MKTDRAFLMACTLILFCGAGVMYEGFRWARAQSRTETGQEPSRPVPRPKRPREKQLRLEKADYVALCRFFETKDPSAMADGRPQVKEIMNHIGTFHADQIRAMAEELKSFSSYRNERQQIELVKFAIESLAARDPESAIALLKQPSEAMAQWNMMQYALPGVLATWHQHDAGAAERWVRHQIESGCAEVDWDTLSKLPGAVAEHDPALAFSLVRDLQKRDMKVEVAAVTRNANSDTSRTAALQALRQMSVGKEATAKETLDSAWLGMAENLAAAGNATADSWLKSADLSDKEILALSKPIILMDELPNRAYWGSWMANHLPLKSMPGRIYAFMESWTRSNHREAGAYIHTMPEGDAKQAAIQAFATTIAPIDAAAAEEWAQTMAPGPRKDRIIRKIRSGF